MALLGDRFKLISIGGCTICSLEINSSICLYSGYNILSSYLVAMTVNVWPTNKPDSHPRFKTIFLQRFFIEPHELCFNL